MKQIGEGWQYKVYELSPTRVRKIKQSWFAQAKRILLSTKEKPYKPFSVVQTIKTTNQHLISSIQQIKDIITAHPQYADLFGNPTFNTDVNYDQDKVITLGEALKNTTTKEKEDFITQYASLIITLWQFGISDNVFNFSINCGVTNDKKVILTDLGEIATTKEKVMRHIKNKRWLEKWSYTTLTDQETKTIYERVMNNNLTLQTLEQHWETQK